MRCRQCGNELARPGDYCLRCRTANADAVVLDLGTERATVTTLADDEVVGERTVTTTADPSAPDQQVVVERRNFAGLVADEIRRKRPEAVYVAGDRDLIARVRGQVHHQFYRVDPDRPVEAAIERRGEPALESVDRPPTEKIGGSHSTLVGGRDGLAAVHAVAEHPHVKKVVPGPIESGGGGSHSGLRAKATRADEHGNVRLLVRDGSSVQENRVVTTAGDRDLGERVRAALNEALATAGLRPSE